MGGLAACLEKQCPQTERTGIQHRAQGATTLWPSPLNKDQLPQLYKTRLFVCLSGEFCFLFFVKPDEPRDEAIIVILKFSPTVMGLGTRLNKLGKIKNISLPFPSSVVGLFIPRLYATP